MASTRVVLPWSTCAIMAIFRMDCIGVQICASAGGQTKRAAGVSQPCFIPFKNDERNELNSFYHGIASLWPDRVQVISSSVGNPAWTRLEARSGPEIDSMPNDGRAS